MMDGERPEAERDWGDRSAMIRDKVADTLRGRPGLLEHAAVILQALPVAPQDAALKEALVRDLREATTQWEALLQSVARLADRLKALPVGDDPSQGIEDEGTGERREEAARAFTRLHEVLQARRATER
jgi:hypothetical protein